MAARHRSPLRDHPRSRAIFVDAPVSSMKISRSGASPAWPSNQSRRRASTSGRRCSAAWPVFFVRQPALGEEVPDRRRAPFHPVPRSDPQADPAHSAAAPHSLPAWLASAFWRIDQHATAPSLLGSPGHRFGSPRCAAPRGRSSTVLAPAGKQYDVCLFPERAEEQSPHVPRKTGNVLTAAWPIAINVLVGMPPDLRNHLEPNQRRRHSSIGYRTPAQARRDMTIDQAA